MASRRQGTAARAAQLEFDFGGAPQAQPIASASMTAGAPPEPAACQAAVVLTESRDNDLQRVADRLHRELCGATGIDIRLRITNNSSTMMSLRYDTGGAFANVGLHHMFLEAPGEIRRALADWIVKPKAKAPGRKLETYIAGQRHLIKSRPLRRIPPRTEGRHFDLKRLYREVNAAHFNGEVTAPITWGKMPSLRRRRSIRFGSYSPGEDLIRIHPLLDQDFVPEFFVRYIVFHEMLHAHLGIEESPNGRRKIHPPEFRQREAAYPDFARSVEWLDNAKNLRRLLRLPGK